MGEDNVIRCCLHAEFAEMDRIVPGDVQAFGQPCDKLLSIRNFTLNA
jgi:hypothetical protein